MSEEFIAMWLSPVSITKANTWMSFPGVKWPGHGIEHPPPSSIEVTYRVELYLYSPPGPSCPVLW